MNSNLLREDLIKLLEGNDAYLKTGLTKLYETYFPNEQQNAILMAADMDFSSFVHLLIEKKLFDRGEVNSFIESNLEVRGEFY